MEIFRWPTYIWKKNSLGYRLVPIVGWLPLQIRKNQLVQADIFEV
jgi:hypothetical protein